MHKLLSFVLLCLLALPFSATHSDASNTATMNVNNLLSQGPQRVVIPTTGMTCMGCAAQIKDSLKSIPGVSNVQVSLVQRTVTVDYDARKVDSSVFVTKIRGLGYKPGKPKQEVK
jgi:copper chaperone CopZ